MSWVRLAAPVAFGHKTNDPVTLVVALAATDSSTHAAAMAQLAKVVDVPPPGPHSTPRPSRQVLAVLGGQEDAAAPAAATAPARGLSATEART